MTGFTNDVSADVLAFGNATAGLNFSGSHLNTNVTANNTGSLFLSANTTVSGTVGAPGAALGELYLGAGGPYTIAFSATAAPVYAITTTFQDTSTATFAGGLSGTTLAFGIRDGTVKIGAGKNLAAAVTNNANTGTLEFLGSTTVANQFGTSAAAGLKQVKFDAGTASIGAPIFTTNAANSLLVKSGATAAITANTGYSGRLTLESGATLDLGTATLAGDTTGANKSDLVTVSGSILKTALSGKVTLDGTNTSIAAGTKLQIAIPTGLAITGGRQFKLVDNATGTGVATLNAADITGGSAMLSFTQVTTGATSEDLVVQASRYTGGYAAASGLPAASRARPAAGALSSLGDAGSATGDMLTVVSTLDSYTAPQLNTALQHAAPNSNAAGFDAAHVAANGAHGNIGSRLASLRGDTAYADAGQTGLAAGDAVTPSRHAWVRAFGSRARADARDGFDGYHADAGGVSFGADTEAGNDWTVGAAFSHADSHVGQQDLHTGDASQIKSYQLAGYATKEFGAAWLDALVSYTRHDNRSNRATALSRTAHGRFDADQWSARLGAGYRLPQGNGVELTPLASLEWSTLRQHAYTETDAGALNLAYAAQTSRSLKSGLGARLSGETEWGNTTVRPEIHANWFHEFGDRRVDTTASFSGGGATFVTPGQELPRDAFNLGGALAFRAGDTGRITVGYDREARSGYRSDNLQVTGRWAF